MGQITDLQRAAWDHAESKGFHDESVTVGDRLALIHSEVSEALEAFREGHMDFYAKDGKPEGVVVELADVIIRIFDFAECYAMDLEDAVLLKMEYNKSRPYKHGGKAI